MTSTPENGLQCIIEAAIMVAGRPLPKADILKLFDETEQPSASDFQAAIQTLQEKYQNSGVELREVASGFQFQAKTEYSPWLQRLWEERPARYSRAFLETLALIAYRQPITRAEIEEIRGVTVSTNIIKTLMEREWIRVIGYKDVPGKPALYGSTKTFLDDFNLKSLDQLPTLAEINDMESQEAKLQVQLELVESDSENPAVETMSEAPPEEVINTEQPAVAELIENDITDEHASSDTSSEVEINDDPLDNSEEQSAVAELIEDYIAEEQLTENQLNETTSEQDITDDQSEDSEEQSAVAELIEDYLSEEQTAEEHIAETHTDEKTTEQTT